MAKRIGERKVRKWTGKDRKSEGSPRVYKWRKPWRHELR
jgi:hypothetical protein